MYHSQSFEVNQVTIYRDLRPMSVAVRKRKIAGTNLEIRLQPESRKPELCAALAAL